jgi:hypothetical protein
VRFEAEPTCAASRSRYVSASMSPGYAVAHVVRSCDSATSHGNGTAGSQDGHLYKRHASAIAFRVDANSAHLENVARVVRHVKYAVLHAQVVEFLAA